jgi:hypothetical protein
LLHKDFIYSQNPRTKVTTAYSLKDVDCIAFCSKDYSKILPYIQEINSKYVSRCIFSFITPYSHTLANMPEIIPFTEEEKDWITMRMGVIAISENNLHLQICRLGKEYPGGIC